MTTSDTPTEIEATHLDIQKVMLLLKPRRRSQC